MNRNNNLNDNMFIEDNLCLKMYDPAVKGHVQDVFDNYTDAAKRLGINYHALRYAASTKTRIYVSLFGKEMAFRLAKRELANAA